MDIGILQQELDELQENPLLWGEKNFRARKEALDFLTMLGKMSREGDDRDAPQARLQEQAQRMDVRLRALNRQIAQNWLSRLKNKSQTPQQIREMLQPYTDYQSKKWGEPHYGYEDLDFLLDEILLPAPRPEAALPPEYGMVRYEPTPASVILELTERIAWKKGAVFYDLGSGLGKVTMLVHLLSGAPSVGVEYQPNFCIYAQEQARRLGLQKVSYINSDARTVNYGEGTIFFLFNPFGGAIFDTVMEVLRKESRRREICLCSYGSATGPLSELSWLERTPPLLGEEMALAIFRSV